MSKKKFLIFILIWAFFILVYMPISNGASLTISLSDSTANIGDTITVKVNGNGISGKISLSASEGGSISPSAVWVDNSIETATLKINGENDVKITATPEDASYSEDASPYTGSTGATVKVKKNTTTETPSNSDGGATTNQVTTGGTTVTTTNNNTPTETKKSNNADLKKLGITPNDFKGFKPATTSYNVTVPNNVEKVSVYATQSDSKATVSGTGAKNLEVGKNTISVTVTAEDGTKKTYTINVTREEEKVPDNTTNNTVDDKTVNETTENEVAEDNLSTTETTNSDLTKLEIAGFTLTPKFSPDVFEYNLKVNEDVTNLDIEAQGANSDVNVEVVGNTDLQDGENVVTIMVYNKKTDKTTTYQIIVEKTKMEIEEVNYNDAIQKAAKIRRIVLGSILFIVVCIIIFIIVKRRSNIDQRADQYEYDEEDEAKLNLDEEEEFFNRVNKTKLKKIERNESDDIEESLPKSIKQTVSKQEFESKLVVDTSEDDKEEEDTPEYFRTSKSGKKGKHF